jgi:hypothetical protein
MKLRVTVSWTTSSPVTRCGITTVSRNQNPPGYPGYPGTQTSHQFNRYITTLTKLKVQISRVRPEKMTTILLCNMIMPCPIPA